MTFLVHGSYFWVGLTAEALTVADPPQNQEQP